MREMREEGRRRGRDPGKNERAVFHTHDSLGQFSYRLGTDGGRGEQQNGNVNVNGKGGGIR